MACISIKKIIYFSHKQKKRQRAAFALRAIIAAGELRFRVRHGNGHVLPAIAAASYLHHGPREPRELQIVSSNPTLPEHSMQRANRYAHDKRLGPLERHGCAPRGACAWRPSTGCTFPGPSWTLSNGGLTPGPASRLDALSAYPSRGRLPGRGTGVPTGAP